MSFVSRADILKDLEADILRLQGYKSAKNVTLNIGLGPIKDAFPNASFPLGTVHEFLTSQSEDSASTSGFLAGLLSSLMENNGTTLWVSSSRTLFPPALKSFGLAPDRFIFIDLQKERDVRWAMEEALKCSALTAVVGEICEIDFTASRRLQLAVEQSHTTGFIIRRNYRPVNRKTGNINSTACVSRWRITSLPSETTDGLPGIGFPKWRVELLRIRNGKPGVWDIHWKDGRFAANNESAIVSMAPPSSHNPLQASAGIVG